jgi:hypothetical protein
LLLHQERLAAAVTETITVAEAAADEAAQQIMALQQDLSRLQATNTALHQTLEEVHSAAASYKQQLAAAADRERELQRKLLQAQLVCEKQGEQLRTQRHAAAAAAASSTKPGTAGDSSRQDDGGGSGEDALAAQALLQQRDAANAALAEARGQLQAQAAELQQIRQALQRADAAAAAAGGSAGDDVAGRGRNSGVRPLPLVLQGQQGQDPAAAAAAGEPSGSSWLDPDWHSALPSPVLNKLLASPGSGASFWLDSAREHSTDHQGPPAAAAAGGAVGANAAGTAPSQQLHRHRSSRHPLSFSADSGLLSMGAVGVARGAGVAALAAQLLNREATNLGSIRDSLEDAAGVLRGSSSSPNSPRPSSRLQHHIRNEAHQQQRQQQQQQDQQVRELAAALVAAEAVGERQRAVISALRQEMEELQAAGELAQV